MNYFRSLLQLIAAFFFFASPANSQDITGTWVGSSGQEYVKLVVIHKGDSVYGYTYDEGPGFCKATFEGKFDPAESQLKGQGMEMLRNSGTHALAVYKLNYSKEGNAEFLRGPVAIKIKKTLFMKKFLVSLSLFAMSTALFAQKPDEVAKFTKETVDLGKIKFDNPSIATFVVKNIGSAPLIIDKAEPTCGCTIGDYTKAPIAPGKEGWIKAEFNAKSLGVFNKNLTVRFAGVNETKTISIKGEVLSAEDYAKLKRSAGNSQVKTKVDENKTKTVIKTDGKKVSKTKVKTKPVKTSSSTAAVM